MNNVHILITGASRGIGYATALACAKAGAQVMATARNIDDLEHLRAASGNTIRIWPADLTQEKDVDGLFEHIESIWDGLDVVINNAGIGIFKPIDQLTLDEWQQVMGVNVQASFLVLRRSVQIMKPQKRGHIVVVASDVAKRAIAHGTLYCASKFAQEGLTASLRKEVRPDGIKVSTVYSGLVDTPFHAYQSPEKSTWLTAADMAHAIINLINQPAHVVIDELMIHPLSQDY
jgi:NADP-dependent 3-hydroxy acid dehydrogenase YdfG